MCERCTDSGALELLVPFLVGLVTPFVSENVLCFGHGALIESFIRSATTMASTASSLPLHERSSHLLRLLVFSLLSFSIVSSHPRFDVTLIGLSMVLQRLMGCLDGNGA